MSGRKNNLKQYNSIANGDMSGSLISAVTDIQFLDDIGIQLNFTGSPVGTFSVQISADYSQDFGGSVTNAGNWVSVTLAYLSAGSIINSTTVPTSVGSPIYLDLTLLSAPYIRVIYTSASGSGTLNSFITGKQI